jgi:GT2 family glycosyltransferase
VRRTFPFAEVVRLPRNEGFARANNLGVQAVADCGLVALLNPDAFPEPGWLAALVNAAAAHPECASFGSHMRMAGDSGRLDGVGDVYHVSGTAWRDRHGEPEGAVPTNGREIFSACAAAALYRREAFCEVGGFDERYFCYFEDVDLGFRLRLRGFSCRYVPDAVVAHAGSASTGYRSDFALYHGHRNMIWTFFKDMPAALLVFYLPQHVLANCAAICFPRPSATVLRAKWDACKGLASVLRTRQALHSTHHVSNRALRRAMTHGFLRPYLRRLRTPA